MPLRSPESDAQVHDGENDEDPFFKKAQIRWFPVLLGVIALAWVMPGNAAAQKGGSPDLSTAIIRVAKDNIPAVVHIEVTRSQEARRPTMPFEGDPFFRYFQDPQRAPGKFKREMRGLRQITRRPGSHPDQQPRRGRCLEGPGSARRQI